MDEYGKMARAYDPATAWALDPLRRELAGVAGACKGGWVLDVCCGTGRQAMFFREAGLRAVGLDLSPAMLERAAQASGKSRPASPGSPPQQIRSTLPADLDVQGGPVPHPGLALLRGDAVRLPFADAVFTLTSVSLALHEKPPALRPLILAEMLRVTAPGGLVAVVDYLSPRSAVQRLLSLGVKAVERLAGREHHAFYAHYMAQGGLEGLLAGSGLDRYELRPRFGGLFGMALIPRDG